MKKTLHALILAACILSALGTAYILYAHAAQESPQPSHLYPATGIVSEVNAEKDTVSFIDFNGFVWEFFGAEDWTKGDIVSAIMDDNGTEIIFDDSIVTVQYSGYVSDNSRKSKGVNHCESGLYGKNHLY